MEHYGEYKPGRALLFRIGSGKVNEDERFLMLVSEDTFGDSEEFLENTVQDGIDTLVMGMNDNNKQYVLNTDEDDRVNMAPYESARDLLFRGKSGIANNTYIASGSPNGPPRISLNERMRKHVAYVDEREEGGTEYNIVNLVVNTEKDIQG